MGDTFPTLSVTHFVLSCIDTQDWNWEPMVHNSMRGREKKKGIEREGGKVGILSK